MKTLLRYENQEMHFFGDGEWEQKVNLFIKKTYFFGLFKKEVKCVYTITMFQDLRSHYEHWDNMIVAKSRF
jgi:hypothetical protein